MSAVDARASALTLDNVSSKCSFCLADVEDEAELQPLTDEIERKFVEFAQCELIAKTLNASTRVCLECGERLAMAHEFKLLLQANQQLLLLLVDQQSDQLSHQQSPQRDDEEYVVEYLEVEEEEVEEEEPAVEDALQQTQKPRQVCVVCGEVVSAAAMRAHIQRKHSTASYVCDACGLLFKMKRDLSAHMRTRHAEQERRRRYECQFCSNVYMKKATLQHHVDMRHVERSESFKCECGASFKTRLRLNYHKKLTHERGEYRCEECDKVYPSMHNLKIHNSHFHAAKSPCIYCGKMVAAGTFMRRHMRTHEPASHECNICSRAFTVRETLLEHQRTVHQMGEAHYCESCGKSFGSNKVLKRHIMRAHTAIEKTVCEVDGCSYAANRKDNLINHVKVHRNLSDEARDEIIARIRARRDLSW